MKLPYLGVVVALLLLNGCVSPKHVKAQPVDWMQKDVDPDCETAQDWGDDPYDTEKPCHFRSTDKI